MPKNEQSLNELIEISRLYGADEQFVLAGGGNTSLKTDGVLYIKASGHALATITAEGFTALDRNKLQRLLETDLGDEPTVREERFKQGVLDARINAASGRPSIESLLHHLIPHRLVVHTHPGVVNAAACCTRGEAIVKRIFGGRVLWIPFTEPGYKLARAMAQALNAFAAGKDAKNRCPDAVILQNHGLIVYGCDAAQVRRATDMVTSKLEKELRKVNLTAPFGRLKKLDADQARTQVNVIAPALRAMLVTGKTLKIVAFDGSDNMLRLTCGANGKKTTDAGPLTPDHIVYCGAFPMWFDADPTEPAEQTLARLAETLKAYRKAYETDPFVVLVAGLGAFTVGDDSVGAEKVRSIFADTANVLARAKALGGVQTIPRDMLKFLLAWEVGAYRRGIAKHPRALGRAAGKVALVTGAAQGFGLEIAADLAEQGATVVLADVNEQGAREAAEKIVAKHGRGRAIGLAANVTDETSVQQMVDAVVRTYGGLDLLVSNAGVLRAQSVKIQPVRDFDFVTAVNYKGYFLCVQKVSPVMAIQHAAKSDYLGDIIQINSKSGLEGSNRNAAYAGSKFGGLGLTQSFALELISDGIKVNSICPGNFLDGPLWSDPNTGLFVQYLHAKKVPGAKTVADVRRAYEAKVPMGRGCHTADVMRAVYYLMEQEYETGQAVPVTGGQVMLR